MPQDRLRSPRGGHGRRTTALSDFEFRVWDQYQLSSDDFGVMRLSAITVQADNDNLADRPSVDVQAALERLVEVGLVAAFDHQGRRYACQLDWQTFQKVEYPRLSALPKPTEDVLARCDAGTRRLFVKHPGGWKKGRKNPRTVPEQPPEQLQKVSGTSPEGSAGQPPEEIPINSRKPLAVSNSSSKSREQEPAADAPAAAARVFETFTERWKRTYGFVCSVSPNHIEMMKLEQHVTKFSEAALLQGVEAFFATDDVFVRNTKHSFPLFLKDPLKYLAKDAAQSGRPRGCKHEPACADDAAHTKLDMADRRAS